MIRDVCLLLGHRTIPVWFADAVEHMLDHTDVSVSSIVVKETCRELEEITGPIYALRWLLRSDFHYKPVLSDPETLTTLDAIEGLSDVPQREYEPVPSVSRTAVPEPVVNDIATSADLVVQWGSGILTGSILTEPEFGVWNFHHGDTHNYRGTPAGFWEFLNGDREAGVTLIRLNEDIDAGSVITRRTTDITDLHRWVDIQARLYSLSEPILTKGIEKINEEAVTPTPPSDPGTLYTRSDMTPSVRLKYLARATTEALRGALTNDG